MREALAGRDGDGEAVAEWHGPGCEWEDCKNREGVGVSAEASERIIEAVASFRNRFGVLGIGNKEFRKMLLLFILLQAVSIQRPDSPAGPSYSKSKNKSEYCYRSR